MESPPIGGPTPPEAETAPGASEGLVTVAVMPKGPKQQPPEPEWIGDGEGTSPAGEWGGGRSGGAGGGLLVRGSCACASGQRPRARGRPRAPGGGREWHMAPREGQQHRS